MVKFSLIFLSFLFAFNSFAEDNFYKERKDMVYNQIMKRGIKDKKVINAMLKVKRHLFVPKNLQKLAYKDSPLPIGENQTISQPYIVALMTELLELKETDKVLEIGTGSGYQAAILAEITGEVYTIEIIPKLKEKAEKLLNELGYKNIKVKLGDGYFGWQEYAPFDCIIITCATKDIPPPLVAQLKEGGRMVLPIGEDYQELVLIKKVNDKLEKRSIIPVIFVPMIRGR